MRFSTAFCLSKNTLPWPLMGLAKPEKTNQNTKVERNEIFYYNNVQNLESAESLTSRIQCQRSR